MSARELHRNMLLQLLKLRRHYPYRQGVLQMACLADVITHDEWAYLNRQVVLKVKEPKLPDTKED